ncbi:MAG: HPr(Ser) kinase/phosphatase [Christensenellales bacterium]
MEEEVIVKTVKLKDFCLSCGLDIIIGNEDDDVTFTSMLVNRPGLLLAGFEDYFGAGRVQLIGFAEHYYFESLSDEDKVKCIERLCSKEIPCMIYARELQPNKIAVEVFAKYSIPILQSHSTTTQLNTVVAGYLQNLLAPSLSCHGTLLDISGTGVLITGESGLGKSETALELVHRGHRLVADDAVIIKKVNNELVGRAPDNIKFFMEVRGIGIIDVRRLYGVGAVLDSEDIHLVIELQKWKDNGEGFDRLKNTGVATILGIEKPKIVLPVMPGRNLAIVVEVAARNFRLKEFGYDPLKELLSNAKITE